MLPTQAVHKLLLAIATISRPLSWFAINLPNLLYCLEFMRLLEKDFECRKGYK